MLATVIFAIKTSNKIYEPTIYKRKIFNQIYNQS